MKTVASTIVNKTQETQSVNTQNQRDNYALAAAFLPFVGVIIWLGMILINNFIVDKSRLAWQTTVATRTNSIRENYQESLTVHGELVTKTNQLAGVIEKDIQPEEVFTLVDKLFPTDRDFTISGFGRESDGSFSVTITADTYLKFARIARRFSTYEKIKNVQVRTATFDSSNLIVGNINFFFTSAKLNSATKS